MNWPGLERLRFVKTLTDNGQEKYKPSSGLFEVLCEKFDPWYNDTILSLQYCKLVRDEKESTEAWIGHLKVKANECEYKQRNRRPKEQFINGTNEDDIMTKVTHKNRKTNP